MDYKNFLIKISSRYNAVLKNYKNASMTGDY